MRRPSLRIAPFVSREHGEAFAESFVARVIGTETVTEAFAATRLMDWPGERDRALMARYDQIEREILGITFQLTKRQIADTFAAVATVVLKRERGRDE
jgi:hypothetical protein